MRKEVEDILNDMYIDRQKMSSIMIDALNNTGLCSASKLEEKACQQSIDFFEIFESHLYYAELKPSEHADFNTKLNSLAIAILKVFYAGVCSVTQKRLSGKDINEINNSEFDTLLRYRVTHETVNGIADQEILKTDEDVEKFNKFLVYVLKKLLAENDIDKYFATYNMTRVLGPIYDAGATYAHLQL